ncbi:X-ray repair cross-complementing protein 5 [Halocaridina rubra]|uniref:X-ray repair cross-complementing protein 5 n=1 Tax=Halocaridina rubra TaxID=373956 RepID=A0AAN8ZZU1_HALRR
MNITYINSIYSGPEIINNDEDDEENNIDGPGPSNKLKSMKNGSTHVSQNWNGKPKTRVQLAGEALITRIVEEIGEGVICSFDDAIPQLLFFHKHSSASGNWNALLNVGPNFQISITGRIKVKHSTPPTWKTVYAHDETGVIIKETSYHLNDDAQTAVDEEDVISGYRYGSTIVPVSEEDFQELKYSSESPRSLSILGYAPNTNVPPSLQAGDQVLVITAREGDEVAAVALSSFIQALAELDYVGITRRIYNKNYNPVLGVLYPEITKEYECLIWIPLPFREDVRMYTFPSLKRTTEKLSDDEKNAMDDLISAMNLFGDDEDDEIMEPTGTLNPELQHFFNMLTHRALHEHDPLPPPAEHIISILDTPKEVVERRDKVSVRLASLFPTKKVVKSTKRDNEDLFASKEEEINKKKKLDDDTSVSASDLSRALVTKVTSATPVNDFNTLLRGDAPNFALICSQIGDVILQLVDNDGGSGPASNAIYSKIVDCLTVFRQESCIIDPAQYNNFISRLKDTVTLRDLRTLWNSVKEGNLGQISSNASLKSNISPEAALKFLELDEQPQEAVPEPKAENADDDFEDLLDDF